MFPVAGKDLLLSGKTQSQSYFFHERFFIFLDQTVIKRERSKVLTLQIEEKEKSLKEKAKAENFYTEEEVFLSC